MTTKPDQRASPRQLAVPMGKALRLIRTRKGLTQTAASKFPGAPDFRTISHWETARKLPSLGLLVSYLKALGLDLTDLQNALDEMCGESKTATLVVRIAALEARAAEAERESPRVAALEARVAALEGAGG